MRCKGCFKRFKNRPGLWKHLSHTHYTPCRTIYLNHLGYLPSRSDDNDDTRDAGLTAADTTSLPNLREYPYLQSYKFCRADNTLETLPDDLPGDSEGEDDLYPTPESDESELEDESQNGDVDLELEPALQAVDRNDPNEAVYEEDPGPNTSPLLNQAEQAEVERSQEPDLQLEIEKFGGKAGQPIRVDRKTAADRHRTQLGSDPEDANPYAPFHSQTDWEVAKWGKLRSPTSTAFTELLEIPGVSP